jgi:hypothetical protein
MKLYSISNLELPLEKIDLGICNAGETKEVGFIVFNDSEAILNDLICSVDNKEVEIISFPKTLKSNEKVSFFVKWKPSITIKQGLKTNFHISGYELYG